MIINSENCFEVGNRAMSAVLLLYYHIIEEGGLSHGQTVYINYDSFNAHDFIDVEVVERENECLDVNETLLRQGSVICFLCVLHNSITEDEFIYSDNDVHIDLLEKYGVSLMPELAEYLVALPCLDDSAAYDGYKKILDSIYQKYVKGFFIGHAGGK